MTYSTVAALLDLVVALELVAALEVAALELFDGRSQWMGGPQGRIRGRGAQLVWRECYTILKNAAVARAITQIYLYFPHPVVAEHHIHIHIRTEELTWFATG